MPPRAQHRNLLLQHFRGWTVRGCLIATGLCRHSSCTATTLSRAMAGSRRFFLAACPFVVVLFAQLHVFDAAARFLHLVKFFHQPTRLVPVHAAPTSRRRSLRAHWSATPRPQALPCGRVDLCTPKRLTTTRPRVLSIAAHRVLRGMHLDGGRRHTQFTAVRPDCPARGRDLHLLATPPPAEPAPVRTAGPRRASPTQHFQRGWVVDGHRPVVRGPHHKQSVIETLILDIFKYVGTAVADIDVPLSETGLGQSLSRSPCRQTGAFAVLAGRGSAVASPPWGRVDGGRGSG